MIQGLIRRNTMGRPNVDKWGVRPVPLTQTHVLEILEHLLGISSGRATASVLHVLL